jgi:hypothetical protein
MARKVIASFLKANSDKLDDKSIAIIKKMLGKDKEDQYQYFINWIHNSIDYIGLTPPEGFKLLKIEALDDSKLGLTFKADKPIMIDSYVFSSASGKNVAVISPSEGPGSDKDKVRTILKKVTYDKPENFQKTKKDWKNMYLVSFNKPITLKDPYPSQITGIETDTYTKTADLKHLIGKYLREIASDEN